MSVSIINSYSKDYGAQVHCAYQRQGSKLRNTVRNRNNVTGALAMFQVIPTKSLAAAPDVECMLYDYYAGDWLDKLDELKIEHDERAVLVNAGAYALGRKTDELIIAELVKSTNHALNGETGLTAKKVEAASQLLGLSAPTEPGEDNETFAIVGWKQWAELLQIEDFSDAVYIDVDDLPWKGTQAKRWKGSIWMPHSGLQKENNVRRCFWYRKTAVGHAVGSEVRSEITYHGDRAAWFINNMMSQAAVVIDPSGIVSMPCLES